jgi:hypothetical protein
MALKFQAPNPKSQIISNDRNPNIQILLLGSFGNWNLGFVWDLDIGIWDLSGYLDKQNT